jgi:hypothetical protein
MNLKIRKFSGLIMGFIIFSILLMVLWNSTSSFDDELVQRVDSGVSAEDLMLDIEEKRENERYKAKKGLESHVMAVEMWGHGDLVSEYDLKYYTDIYNGETQIIDDHAEVRKEFVRGEISKEDFLEEVDDLNGEMRCVKY